MFSTVLLLILLLPKREISMQKCTQSLLHIENKKIIYIHIHKRLWPHNETNLIRPM